MTLEEIRGQDAAVGHLRTALASGRLGHALVFAGPPGVGKRTTALALARALLCAERPGEGCGACGECSLIAAGTHPDVVVEDLEAARRERPTASLLSIEQIRRLRSRLALRPVRGERKIGLIDPADRSTADAQNALLKTLEEPRGHAFVILVCTNRQALLPTIRSRCQTLGFAPLEEEVVAEILAAEGVAEAVARSAAALADGSLERARALADEETRAQREEIRASLDGIRSLDAAGLLDLAERWAGGKGERARARQELAIATVLEWCRERMVREARESARQLQPQAGEREADDADDRLVPVRLAARRLEAAYASARSLEANANPMLAWTELLFALRRLSPARG